MICSVSIASQGSEMQATIGQWFDCRQLKPIDVDDPLWSFNSILHQVNEIGPSGQKLRRAFLAERFASDIDPASAAHEPTGWRLQRLVQRLLHRPSAAQSQAFRTTNEPAAMQAAY